MIEVPERMVEAGGKGIYDAEPNYEDDPVIPWENAGQATQARYIEMARVCLAAALAGAEVVACDVTGSVSDFHVSILIDPFKLRRGDTLLLLRGAQ